MPAYTLSFRRRLLSTLQYPFWQLFWVGPWFVCTAHCHVWWILHGVCVEHEEHTPHRFKMPWCRCQDD